MKWFLKWMLPIILTGALCFAMVRTAAAQRGSPGARHGYRSGATMGRPYYRPYYPRFYTSYGFGFGFPSFGYYPFYMGSNLYQYGDGMFYRRYDRDNYRPVSPPMGAEVPKLPRKAKEVVIDGRPYYELNGVYYKPNMNEEGKTVYRVVGKDGVLSTKVLPESTPAPMPKEEEMDLKYR